MKKDNEKRVAAMLVRIMAMLCVRNTQPETLHAGVGPITRTGDYSDDFVAPSTMPRLSMIGIPASGVESKKGTCNRTATTSRDQAQTLGTCFLRGMRNGR